MVETTLKNSQDPYKIVFYKNTGLSSFKTSYELTYFCGFENVTSRLSPLLGVYDIEIYDFQFYPYDPIPGKKKGKDSRIAITITTLVNDFFSNNSRVLLYVCDATDGCAGIRQELFGKWYRKQSYAFNRHQLSIELETTSNELLVMYACILTRKDFPYLDVLKKELIDQAKDIALEKYGQQS